MGKARVPAPETFYMNIFLMDGEGFKISHTIYNG